MIRLSDEQWERTWDHLPEENIPDGRPGHKPIPTRRVLGAVLWIRRYARRWLVERFFALIQWQRRILVRWEYYTRSATCQRTSASRQLPRKGIIKELSFCRRHDSTDPGDFVLEMA
jgi:transposase